jgi:hypothetical protein
MSNITEHSLETADWENRLPWEIMAEFWTLPEVMTMRQVSPSVCDAMQELSPQKCANLLETALRKRNLHTIPFGTWKNHTQDAERLGEVLRRDAQRNNGADTAATTAFDVMMRYFRVMKYLPKDDVAVGFSAKYGRHCIPLQWNEEKKTTEAVIYPSCTRDNCRTCRLRVPTADDVDEWEIYDHVNATGKNGRRLKLTSFYNKCMPNLPPDLVCPCCRSTDGRTLVLSSYSYKSSSVATRQTLLTYTPRDNDENEDNSEDSESDGDEDDAEQERAVKRARREVRRPEAFDFPSMYTERMLPSLSDGHRHLSADSKHAVAIHCVSCQQFGILAPSGLCWHDAFPCHDRKRKVEFGKYSSLVGGVLVRRACAMKDCLGTVLCRACSSSSTHEAFWGALTVAYKNSCQSCKNGPFCSEHAYLATVCHHW